MKKPLIFIFTVLLFSCRKGDIQLTPGCQAVTYYIDSYDENWNYVKTDVSIHWCNVCGEELDRFKSYEKLSELCNENKFMRLVISEDTCQTKF
jgi:hypothetical protein